MTVASVCPDCGALLRHTKPLPGGVTVPMEVSCPDCDYEQTVAP